jgi:hypothetical protein
VFVDSLLTTGNRDSQRLNLTQITDAIVNAVSTIPDKK